MKRKHKTLKIKMPKNPLKVMQYATIVMVVFINIFAFIYNCIQNNKIWLILTIVISFIIVLGLIISTLIKLWNYALKHCSILQGMIEAIKILFNKKRF